MASLNEGGDEILTFLRFPREQWKSIRSTNVIERINEEFRRRVKTQGSFPTEDARPRAALRLVASSQIRLRKLSGYEKIVDVISNAPRITIAT